LEHEGLGAAEPQPKKCNHGFHGFTRIFYFNFKSLILEVFDISLPKSTSYKKRILKTCIKNKELQDCITKDRKIRRLEQIRIVFMDGRHGQAKLDRGTQISTVAGVKSVEKLQ